MTRSHPIKDLEVALEAERTLEIERLAASGSTASEGLSRIVALQIALTAIRETIGEHGARLGWVGDESSLEQRATSLTNR
jgi:hypothetical protein